MEFGSSAHWLGDRIAVADVEFELPLALESSVFCEDMQFDKLKIGGFLSLEDTVLLKQLSIANSTLGNDLTLQNAIVGDVEIRSTTINGTVNFANAVGARLWQFVGSTVGQLTADRANLGDLDITDTELKRGFRSTQLKIRKTLLLKKSTIGSDLDLASALLTTTTIRRSTIKSDLRLTNVVARCSTKIHKSKIEGDMVIENYSFGRVTVEQRPATGPHTGKFYWKPEGSPISSDPDAAAKTALSQLAPKAPAAENDSSLDFSECTIVTPQEGQTPQIYRSSGVLEIIDSAIAGNACLTNLLWQRTGKRSLPAALVRIATRKQSRAMRRGSQPRAASFSILRTSSL